MILPGRTHGIRTWHGLHSSNTILSVRRHLLLSLPLHVWLGDFSEAAGIIS